MTDSSGADGHGPVRQLIGSVSGLLATVVSMGRTRLELLSVEVQEQARRIVGTVIWALVGLLTAAAGLVFAALTVIIAFWDSHRLLAASMVTATFLGIALVAALVVIRRVRGEPGLLAATRAELRRDEEVLRRIRA